jgi:hypothetical protein
VRIWSDLPGFALAERVSAIPTPSTTTRRQIRFRVEGVVKGHLFQFQWSPGMGTGRLYRARAWARELPTGAWGWYALPVPETPDEWSALQLPMPASPEEWSAIALPVPVSPQEWSTIALPVPESPQAWSSAQLPIPGTAEDWNAVNLPVRPTPVVPEWVPVEIDQ